MNQKRKIVWLLAVLTAAASMSVTGCGIVGGKKTVAVTTAVETTEEITQTVPVTEVPTVVPTTVEETTEAPLESSLEETEEPEPLVLYTTAKVNLRAEPSTDADILTLIPLGAGVTVVEEGAEWHRVVYEGQEGFVSAEYVTADLDSASKKAEENTTEKETTKKAKKETKKEKETTKKEKETTKKETEATKKETEATKEETEPSKKETKEETEPSKKETKAAKKEVSRKRYDDPDGSGHGYWEITYDDGSTEIIEF